MDTVPWHADSVDVSICTIQKLTLMSKQNILSIYCIVSTLLSIWWESLKVIMHPNLIITKLSLAAVAEENGSLLMTTQSCAYISFLPLNSWLKHLPCILFFAVCSYIRIFMKVQSHLYKYLYSLFYYIGGSVCSYLIRTPDQIFEIVVYI